MGRRARARRLHRNHPGPHFGPFSGTGPHRRRPPRASRWRRLSRAASRATRSSIETRIITTADIFDAITAERPYRGAMPITKALAIMSEMVGTQIDADCFAALTSRAWTHRRDAGRLIGTLDLG